MTADIHATATFLTSSFSIGTVLHYPRLDSPSGATAENGQSPRFLHVSMVVYDRAYL
ncbi:MAG: hypothetical protein OXT74_05150 [Candidatus Poribacteria bacterium]|nr:hypothetical protein [Candidatus Poribacteria bacterium]